MSDSRQIFCPKCGNMLQEVSITTIENGLRGAVDDLEGLSGTEPAIGHLCSNPDCGLVYIDEANIAELSAFGE